MAVYSPEEEKKKLTDEANSRMLSLIYKVRFGRKSPRSCEMSTQVLAAEKENAFFNVTGNLH